MNTVEALQGAVEMLQKIAKGGSYNRVEYVERLIRMITYESRVAAYNEASELLKARPKMLPGWFVCKRKDGDFVLWPMVGMPPKTYRVVDEVFS